MTEMKRARSADGTSPIPSVSTSTHVLIILFCDGECHGGALAQRDTLSEENIKALEWSSPESRHDACVPGCNETMDLGELYQQDYEPHSSIWTLVTQDKISETTNKTHCQVVLAYSSD